MAEPTPNRDVFINCPFDPSYLDVFRAIVFAVRACGYTPRTAKDESDSARVRIDRIYDLIEQCDRGIHDLSAVALDKATATSRFNMPLELGISIGAKRFGGPRQRIKRLLVLEAEPHRYDQSTSNISGQDIATHRGEPGRVIAAVRDWLADNRPSGEPIPAGAGALASDYGQVRAHIDKYIATNRLDPWPEMTHVDYLTCLDAALLLLAQEQAS